VDREHALSARSGRFGPRLVPTAARALVLAAVLVVAPTLCAAQLSAAGQQEVRALLQAVGTSGCTFYRAGVAYPAEQARKHLTSKYDAMAARGLLATTEDFIDKVAAASSVTGQPYAVHCADRAAQSSRDWMRGKLEALRQRPSG
jgi:hypothetical protein